jgi:hypothetical protein
VAAVPDDLDSRLTRMLWIRGETGPGIMKGIKLAHTVSLHTVQA